MGACQSPLSMDAAVAASPVSQGHLLLVLDTVNRQGSTFGADDVAAAPDADHCKEGKEA